MADSDGSRGRSRVVRTTSRPRAASRRTARKVNPRRGPSVESFLREEGILESAMARAIKEVVVFQIEGLMKRDGITKAELARRMATSRAAIDRLLDPKNGSMTLATLFRVAGALGEEVRVEIGGRKMGRGRKVS